MLFGSTFLHCYICDFACVFWSMVPLGPHEFAAVVCGCQLSELSPCAFSSDKRARCAVSVWNSFRWLAAIRTQSEPGRGCRPSKTATCTSDCPPPPRLSLPARTGPAEVRAESAEHIAARLGSFGEGYAVAEAPVTSALLCGFDDGHCAVWCLLRRRPIVS